MQLNLRVWYSLTKPLGLFNLKALTELTKLIAESRFCRFLEYKIHRRLALNLAMNSSRRQAL